ncbi:hypothetical protein G9A89_020428 [Geosiphon pyriformis]|nr:hypothetical protein G9A89_020428 [Geosiphon pyriformis]
MKYFSNNNSINCLANIFTTIKQEESEAVTIYLRCFYRNLYQIQAINTNYFTVAQILNQFIHGLYSSILQYVHPLYLADFQAAITHARDFESAKFKANYTQAVNLVINRSSELDSKTISIELLIHDATANLSTTNLSVFSTCSLLIAVTIYLLIAVLSNLSAPANSNTTIQLITHIQQNWKSSLETEYIQNLNSQNDLSLLVIPEDTTFNSLEANQKQLLTNNILPATITKDKSFTIIFFFEFKKPVKMPLFSRAALKSKLITAIYTDTKVDGQPIKLILNSCRIDCAASVQIITTYGAIKTLIGKIDNFFFEINSIITSIKVLIMELVMTGYPRPTLYLIRTLRNYNSANTANTLEYQQFLEEKEKKPIWEAYQVLWADHDYNKLPPILIWEEKRKEKEREKELTIAMTFTYTLHITTCQTNYY